MVFIQTYHSKERLEERQIRSPETCNLKPIGKKLKKHLMVTCSTYDPTRHSVVYFYSIQNKKTAIYVCKILDIGKYLLLTAFNKEKIEDYET